MDPANDNCLQGVKDVEKARQQEARSRESSQTQSPRRGPTSIKSPASADRSEGMPVGNRWDYIGIIGI